MYARCVKEKRPLVSTHDKEKMEEKSHAIIYALRKAATGELNGLRDASLCAPQSFQCNAVTLFVIQNKTRQLKKNTKQLLGCKTSPAGRM